MVVIAVDYARNDCQHPTAAKRSEKPQDCVPGLSVWLDSLLLQDTKDSAVSGGPRYMMEDSQRFLSLSQASAGRQVDCLQAAFTISDRRNA
jgi:hypothetical protein